MYRRFVFFIRIMANLNTQKCNKVRLSNSKPTFIIVFCTRSKKTDFVYLFMGKSKRTIVLIEQLFNCVVFKRYLSGCTNTCSYFELIFFLVLYSTEYAIRNESPNEINTDVLVYIFEQPPPNRYKKSDNLARNSKKIEY